MSTGPNNKLFKCVAFVKFCICEVGFHFSKRIPDDSKFEKLSKQWFADVFSLQIFGSGQMRQQVCLAVPISGFWEAEQQPSLEIPIEPQIVGECFFNTLASTFGNMNK